MGLFLILFFNENDEKKYNLSGHYTKNATQYQGSIYKQGFALSGKIDDKSLVSSPLWQTLLKGGIKQKDFYLFRSFFYYWWHNFSLKDINNDKHFLCVEKDKLLYYRQGDVVLKENNHYAVFIKYASLKQPKKELWITCTPERGCYEFITNDTAGKYDVYRWKIFEKYLNR